MWNAFSWYKVKGHDYSVSDGAIVSVQPLFVPTQQDVGAELLNPC